MNVSRIFAVIGSLFLLASALLYAYGVLAAVLDIRDSTVAPNPGSPLPQGRVVARCLTISLSCFAISFGAKIWSILGVADRKARPTKTRPTEKKSRESRNPYDPPTS